MRYHLASCHFFQLLALKFCSTRWTVRLFGNRGEQHEIEQIFSSLDINNNEEVWKSFFHKMMSGGWEEMPVMMKRCPS